MLVTCLSPRLTAFSNVAPDELDKIARNFARFTFDAMSGSTRLRVLMANDVRFPGGAGGADPFGGHPPKCCLTGWPAGTFTASVPWHFTKSRNCSLYEPHSVPGASPTSRPRCQPTPAVVRRATTPPMGKSSSSFFYLFWYVDLVVTDLFQWNNVNLQVGEMAVGIRRAVSYKRVRAIRSKEMHFVRIYAGKKLLA